METAEEKAREYSNSEGIYDEHGETLLHMGYLAGYTEAMRWRDPKVELPPVDKVKHPNGNYSDDVLGEAVIDGEKYLVYYDYDNEEWYATMEGDDFGIHITKWRPIE